MIFRLLFLLIFICVNSYAVVKQDLSNNDHAQKKARLLSKLAFEKQVLGENGAENRSVYEDLSTGATTQLSTKVEFRKKSTDEITAKVLLSPLPDDKLLGDPKAPILMVEYASLTCYHCSLFHKDVFPKIKKKYIDTGKMLYIFRHFPLDYRALKAAMLSHCYEKQEDYFNFNKAVFNSIDSWNYSNLSDLTVLQRVAALSNLKQDTFSQCIDDEKIMDKIINDKSLAINKLGIMATPIFFIKLNDNKLYVEHDKVKHEGYKNFEYFANVIDELYEQTTVK